MYALWLMETDWKAEIFKRLDALSEKLGVAASHLWQVLVRQGMAEAVANLIMAVCWLIILIVAAKVLLWARKTGELKRGDGRYNDWTIVSSLTLVTSVGLFMSCVYDFTIWAVNPEYFAIQKVIELFK
jgi:hypothetical protein